jgi:RimJ/RimL family protein N-acetyltransferase
LILSCDFLKPGKRENGRSIKQRLSVLEQLYKKVKHAILAAELGGIYYLLSETMRRAYRKETFIGLKKHLTEAGSEVPSKIEYSLQLASKEDMAEVFLNIKNEGKEAYFDLLQRKWFYESGFHNCYVARAKSSNEICYMGWTIALEDGNSASSIFKKSFPWLGPHDIQIEHCYTFKKYRGKQIMSSVTNQLFKFARKNGFEVAIAYVLSSNTNSIKAFEKAGFKKSEEIRRIKFLFYTRYQVAQLAKHSSTEAITLAKC